MPWTRLLVNEIFARNGYIFKDPRYQRIFGSCKWYHGKNKNGGKVYKLLSKKEKKNVDIILAEEKRQKGKNVSKLPSDIQMIKNDNGKTIYSRIGMITNTDGQVVAYRMTADSPDKLKGVNMQADYNKSMGVTQADIDAAYNDIDIRDLPEIRINGNAFLIKRMFSNIIDNAIKYSSEYSNISVTLTTEDRTAEICIKDSGVGIPEEALPHIFERFYRVDNSRTRATGGSGLGLAIVKTIVELHRGSISVDSSIDQGTRVCITLQKR